MYENRKYLIIPITEISKVDFSQVYETSVDTLRKSTDGTKTFVNWDQSGYNSEPYEIIIAETNETQTIYPQELSYPLFVSTIVGAEGPYTYDEILEILNSPEWTVKTEEL